MLLPDVRDLLDDPDIGGGAPFVVVRRRYRYEFGRAVLASSEELPFTGNVQPAGSKDLIQLPEEDQHHETIVIRAAMAFQTGKEEGDMFIAADEIRVLGRVWRIVRVENWNSWGFSVAYAQQRRLEGDE